MWLAWNARRPFVAIAATGIFAIAQIFFQDRLLPRVLRWRVPVWLRFGSLGGLVAIGGLILLLATHLIEGQPPRWTLSEWLGGSVPYSVLFLLGWYRAWWHVLRRGWIDVPSSLLAAGAHATALIGLMDFVFAWGGWWVWLWFTPSNFLIGWSLMFLPGALAAHECPPAARADTSLALRILAPIVPALCGIIPLALVGWAFTVLRG